MIKPEQNLQQSIQLFLNSWGWPIVEKYDAKDLALDYIEETGGDLAEFDEVLAAVKYVKTANGY